MSRFFKSGQVCYKKKRNKFWNSARIFNLCSLISHPAPTPSNFHKPLLVWHRCLVSIPLFTLLTNRQVQHTKELSVFSLFFRIIVLCKRIALNRLLEMPAPRIFFILKKKIYFCVYFKSVIDNIRQIMKSVIFFVQNSFRISG